MPLMNAEVFKGYADRVGGQFKILRDAVLSMSAGTDYFTRLSATPDPDVEIPMLAPARNQDLALDASNAAVLIAKQMPKFTALITAFDSHLYAQTENEDLKSWDHYCTNKGVRVPDSANKVHFARYGRYMLARNVFCEDEVSMITCTISPSGTPMLEDGFALGTGSVSEKADGKYAGAQLMAVLLTDVDSGMDIEIVGKSETGLTRRLSTSGSLIAGPSGTRIAIPPPSGRFVSVSDINILSGGTQDDVFELVSIIERQTSL